MPKTRKSNREAKKEPAMTLKEKRAAKKAKGDDGFLLGSINASRKTADNPGAKRT